jgi:hypothetical protein
MATHVAVRARLIELNRAGGVGGRRLELVSLDDQGENATAHERLRELARDPLVVAILARPGISIDGYRVVAVSSTSSALASLETILGELRVRP